MINILKKPSYSTIVIFLFFLIIPLYNFNHHRYAKGEGVIDWDIKSYYAYLPATFIYHDLSLSFIDSASNQELKKWIWPIITPTGKKAILTTMGLSVLYAPFFFIAHTYASLSPQYEANGYSLPYHVALQFSTYIYFLLSLLVLKRILSKYFNDKVTALTLLAIGAGTNLFFYVGYAAPMPHGYNFLLITLFIFILERWTEDITVKDTILLGLLSGWVTLIRPTNIIILILIPLWQVGSWKDLKSRIQLLLQKWPYILLMAFFFVLFWVPQFAYWKYVSGKFFYFSYGERQDRFYFNNPQIWKILFSYEKGWFVYTPMMMLAVFGIFILPKKKIKLALPIVVYLVLMIYVLSSWWCWWYGGSFGQRSMVDFYGLMAIPLAAIIDSGLKKRIYKYLITFLILILIAYNQFNIKQYRNMAISFWWMNKEGYWENFLKVKPTCKYWNIAMHPDYVKARLGIYEPIAPYNKNQVVSDEMLINQIINENRNNQILIDSLISGKKDNSIKIDSILKDYAKQIVDIQMAEPYFYKIKIDYYLNQIEHCVSWKKEIEKKAKRKKITYQQMAMIEAKRIYNNYSQKYDQR
jgi:hypothetical protein